MSYFSTFLKIISIILFILFVIHSIIFSGRMDYETKMYEARKITLKEMTSTKDYFHSLALLGLILLLAIITAGMAIITDTSLKISDVPEDLPEQIPAKEYYEDEGEENDPHS